MLQRASCMLLTLGLGGCYSLVEAGYGNAASGRTGGVATGAVRLGLGDPREGSGARLMSVETALRVDASGAATRGAMGFGAVFVSQGGRFTPFARPAVWIAPFRGGDARHDNVVLPSLDLGALFSPGDRNSGTVFSVGTRAEWLGRPDDWAGGLGLYAYVGIGLRDRVNIRF